MKKKVMITLMLAVLTGLTNISAKGLGGGEGKNDPGNDPFAIIEVNPWGNELDVTISYLGGCKTHQFDFKLVDKSSGDAKSAEVIIIHDAAGDDCTAVVTQTLAINLDELLGDGVNVSQYDVRVINGYKQTEVMAVSMR